MSTIICTRTCKKHRILSFLTHLTYINSTSLHSDTKLDEESLYYIELHRAVPVSHTFYRLTFDDDGKLVNLVVGPVKPPLTLEDLHRSRKMRQDALEELRLSAAAGESNGEKIIRKLQVGGKDLGFRVVLVRGEQLEKLRRIDDRIAAFMRAEEAKEKATEGLRRGADALEPDELDDKDDDKDDNARNDGSDRPARPTTRSLGPSPTRAEPDNAMRVDRPMATLQAEDGATDNADSNDGAAADTDAANGDGRGGGEGIAGAVRLTPRLCALVDIVRSHGDRGETLNEQERARRRQESWSGWRGGVHERTVSESRDTAINEGGSEARGVSDAAVIPAPVSLTERIAARRRSIGRSNGRGGEESNGSDEKEAGADTGPQVSASVAAMKEQMGEYEVELGHLFVDGRPSRLLLIERLRLLRGICRKHGLNFYDISGTGTQLKPGHVLCHEPMDLSVAPFLHYEESNLVDSDVNDVCDARDSYNSLDCLRQRNAVSARAHTEPSALSYTEATAAIHGLGLDRLAKSIAWKLKNEGSGCFDGVCAAWGDVGRALDAERCLCVPGCMTVEDLDSLADEFGTW